MRPYHFYYTICYTVHFLLSLFAILSPLIEKESLPGSMCCLYPADCVRS